MYKKPSLIKTRLQFILYFCFYGCKEMRYTQRGAEIAFIFCENELSLYIVLQVKSSQKSVKTILFIHYKNRV